MNWLALLIVLLIPQMVEASCSGSGLTWSCTSGSTSSQIQTAMNSATDGATITFDNGTYTSSSMLTFSNSKGVTLQCATVRGCTVNLTNTFAGCFCFLGTNTKLYRVSGFVFDGQGTFSGVGVIWLDSNAGDTFTLTQFRVDNNTFQNAPQDSYFGVFVCDTDSYCYVSGLIDHNIWSNSTIVVVYYYLGDRSTSTANVAGTADNVFIEDNQFTFTNITSGSGLPCTDAQGGSRMVIRFNTGTNCTWGGHGAKHNGGQQNSELYGNVITMTSGADTSPFVDNYHIFHHQGSGQIYVWGNQLTSPAGWALDSGVFAFNDYRAFTNANGSGTICDGLQGSDGNRSPTATYRGYPCDRQAGRTFGGVLAPTYSWKNVYTNTGARIDLLAENNCGGASPCYFSEHFVENRDWYQSVSVNAQTSSTSPFDGTVGVGFGTLANRPTTCTTNSESADAGHGGVGYWATDQGSWNQSTTNPYGVQANGADGVLYVCTDTNTWSTHYTPYTYPHPLQGFEGGGSSTGGSMDVKHVPQRNELARTVSGR